MLRSVVILKISGAFLFLCQNDVVVYSLEGHSDVPCKIIAREMPDSCFNRLICLCVKCEEAEIFLSEEFLWRCNPPYFQS
jgi:hypothetical protein